jgi:hypothetical protein
MPSTVKKVIHRIRGTRTPPPFDAEQAKKALRKANQKKNFAKAKTARALNIEQRMLQRAEEEAREAALAAERLANLKKARRRLKFLRKKEAENAEEEE